MAARQHGAFRQADGQAVAGTHPQDQWNSRAPPGWADYPVRSAWVEGRPVDVPFKTGYARYHLPSGMLLIARWGFIRTTIPLQDRTEGEQQLVREQVDDYDHVERDQS